MKKCKVFYERSNNLEGVINDWLEKNKLISIVSSTQSTEDGFIIVTVFYQ